MKSAALAVLTLLAALAPLGAGQGSDPEQAALRLRIADLRARAAGGAKDAGLLLQLGDALLEAGQVTEAVPAFRSAAELRPEDRAAQFKLGSALMAQVLLTRELYPTAPEDFDRAQAALEKAISLGENGFEARADLALVLYHKGLYAKSIAESRKALALNPQYVAGYTVLSSALRCKGDYKGAIKQAEAGLSLSLERTDAPSPVRANLIADRAAAKRGQGDIAGDAEDLRKALARDPASSYILSELSRALRRSGDLDGAVAQGRAAVAADPRDGWAHAALAEALRDKGLRIEALAEAEAAVSAAPQAWKPLRARGLLLAKLGRQDEAPRDLRRYVELERKSPCRRDRWEQAELDEAAAALKELAP